MYKAMMDAPKFLDGYIDLFLRRRVCARCYGDLASRPAKDYSPANHVFEAYCPNCEGAWHYATISVRYAERLGQQAIADLWDVKSNMPDLFPRVRMSESKILADLGF